jgi:lipid-A-disaccharide synthase
MKVALLTNGPGELWGWVRPVAAELRKREHSVSLWLLPCQFASGYERAVASGLGVDKLEGPSGSAWTWRALAQEKTDCVLQLGGDLLFGRRIASRAGVPFLCYAYGFKKGMEHTLVFTAYHEMADAIDARLETPARVIGDLVKDSLSLESGDAEAGRNNVLLFPGSRPAIRTLSLKWLSKVTRHMRALLPDVRFATLFSPFVPENELPVWADAVLNPIRRGAGAAMRAADFALTQPGTNTLEMMHCGLPALVAAPFDCLDVVPLGGLAHFAFALPLAGPAIKKWKIRKTLERSGGFVSWPNRIAGRAVMDEAVGQVNPYDLAEGVVASLKDEKKLSRVRGELLALSGEGGAASRLCDAVENSVK